MLSFKDWMIEKLGLFPTVAAFYDMLATNPTAHIEYNGSALYKAEYVKACLIATLNNLSKYAVYQQRQLRAAENEIHDLKVKLSPYSDTDAGKTLSDNRVRVEITYKVNEVAFARQTVIIDPIATGCYLEIDELTGEYYVVIDETRWETMDEGTAAEFIFAYLNPMGNLGFDDFEWRYL